MKYTSIFIITLFAYSNVNAQTIPLSKASNNAKVYIISPTNGESVKEKFIVKFGLQGMGIAPAGVEYAFTGHHHLIIDGEIPNSKKPMGVEVIHFGKGQTQTELKLSPGQHSLQLILGDFKHTPHDKPIISEKITILVE